MVGRLRPSESWRSQTVADFTFLSAPRRCFKALIAFPLLPSLLFYLCVDTALALRVCCATPFSLPLPLRSLAELFFFSFSLVSVLGDSFPCVVTHSRMVSRSSLAPTPARARSLDLAQPLLFLLTCSAVGRLQRKQRGASKRERERGERERGRK